MKTQRIWIYWNEGIVRITVRADRPFKIYSGGTTDEGWSEHLERYSIEDGELKREMRDSGSDCDGRYERGVRDYWQPAFGFVPCIEIDSHGNTTNLPQQRPNWKDDHDVWQRDYSAEAAGY